MNFGKTLSAEGAIWVATGQKHVYAARESCCSFKLLNKGRKTALFTDIDHESQDFDYVFPIPSDSVRPKIDMLANSPFSKTIYFDSDTIILSDLSAIYQILDRFDLAGCQVQLWQRPRHRQSHRLELPDLFPEINCGVLAYRKNDTTDVFFEKWSKAFLDSKHTIDQPTFRETLWDESLDFYVLPEQVNKRLIDPCELLYTDKPSPLVVHLPVLRPSKNLRHAFFRKISRWFWTRRMAKNIDLSSR